MGSPLYVTSQYLHSAYIIHHNTQHRIVKEKGRRTHTSTKRKKQTKIKKKITTEKQTN